MRIFFAHNFRVLVRDGIDLAVSRVEPVGATGIRLLRGISVDAPAELPFEELPSKGEITVELSSPSTRSTTLIRTELETVRATTKRCLTYAYEGLEFLACPFVDVMCTGPALEGVELRGVRLLAVKDAHGRGP